MSEATCGTLLGPPLYVRIRSAVELSRKGYDYGEMSEFMSYMAHQMCELRVRSQKPFRHSGGFRERNFVRDRVIQFSTASRPLQRARARERSSAMRTKGADSQAFSGVTGRRRCIDRRDCR
jgi:hypothetical protein